MDPCRTLRGRSGGVIAHGYLLLSLIMPMLAEILRVDGVSMAVNMGVDRLRIRSVCLPVGGCAPRPRWHP